MGSEPFPLPFQPINSKNGAARAFRCPGQSPRGNRRNNMKDKKKTENLTEEADTAKKPAGKKAAEKKAASVNETAEKTVNNNAIKIKNRQLKI